MGCRREEREGAGEEIARDETSMTFHDTFSFVSVVSGVRKGMRRE